MVKCYQCRKYVIDGTTKSYWYPNIHAIFNKAQSVSMEQKYHWRFFDFSNQYVSNISNIFNLNLNMGLSFQTKCDRMFSDLESDHIFSIFKLHTRFIFCFFSYLVITHLLRRGKGVVIYRKLITYWIDSTWSWILFPA